MVLQFSSAFTPGFSVGQIEFGVYGGRKIILEYNASPLIVYWKKE